MEIIRKVFCGTSYEGLYKLVKNDRYEWIYIDGTTGDQVNIDELDYPIINIEKGRESQLGILSQHLQGFLLQTSFYFEPQDLEDGNSLGG